MWLALTAAWAGSQPHPIEAAGRSEVVLTAPRFGRYSFETQSEVGIAVQLVDRRSGPGLRDGVTGDRNGRVDAFVDAGQIKVITEAPSDGSGNAVLEITRFERQVPDRVLTFRSHDSTELADQQERAWWVEIDGPVAFEAVGRHLADLRLWRDGTWLDAARPSCRTVEAEVGRPVKRCEIKATPEPGLYQLVAYGSPGDPWAEDVPERWLEVQWDAPLLPRSGQHVGRISRTGVDWYVVPDAVDTAHLVLPDNADTSVSLTQYTRSDPYRTGSTAAIRDTSRVPEATATSSHSGETMIAVKGTPGQRYALTWFHSSRDGASFAGRGSMLVTSVSTARPEDTLSPTGVLYRNATRQILVRSLALKLDGGQRFEERFNLNQTTRLWFEVEESARFKFTLSDLPGTIQVSRFFTTPVKDYQAPKARESVFDDTLEPGLYTVDLSPTEPGIATLTIEGNGWGDTIGRATSSQTAKVLRPGLMAIIDTDPATTHTLRFAGAPDTRTGVVLRELPLDPREQAPLNLLPGESFGIPVDLREADTLRARLPNGELLPLAGGGLVGTELALPAGPAMITVTNPTDEPVVAVLGTEPPRATAPRVPQTLLGKLPDFPTLTEPSPQFFDLDRQATKTFRLKLEGDGLYEVVSTGLLATRGTLRSRIELNLGSDSQGGEGRNFRVGQYMLSGDYQLNVQLQGQSAGHLGVRLRRTPLIDGGALRDQEIARATVEAGAGIRYTFEVPERGRYHLRSAGQSTSFPCRLEDAEGWPVTRPTDRCDLHRTLDPGTYALISLPTGVRTLRQTTLTRDTLPEPFSGHGPHVLPLGGSIEHTWMEKPGADPRPEDRWAFTLPADLEVSIALDSEMSGHIVKDGERIDRLTPGRTWSGVLRAGTYELVLQAARRGTGIPYSVSLSSESMTIGQRRILDLPARVPLRIGAGGLVSIASEGGADVRARLLDGGRVVAANDDRPDGWNFLLDAWLEAGDYTLELESDGGARRTTVRVDSPAQEEGVALKSSRKPKTLTIDRTTRLHALSLNRRKPVLVKASSAQNLGIGLERKTDTGWTSLGTATGREITLLGDPDGAEVRLRIWSLDGRSGEAEIRVQAVNPIAPSIASLRQGVHARGGGMAVVVGSNVEPGLYRVLGDRSKMMVCAQPGEPCGPMNSVVAIDTHTLVLAESLTMVRAKLGQAVPIELSERGVHMELDRTLRALVVRSATGLPGVQLAQGSTALSSDAAIAIGRGDATLRGAGVGRVAAIPLTETDGPSWSGKAPLTIQVPPRSSMTIEGPGKRATRLSIALEHGLVASSDGQAVWADTDGVDAGMLAAGEVRVSNPTQRPAIAVLQPYGEESETLSEGAPVERFASRAGVEMYRVTAFDGQLRSYGASLTYLRDDGVRLTGEALDVGPGGIVWATHGKGWYAVWTDAAGPWIGESEGLRLLDGVTRVSSDNPFAVRLQVGERTEVFWRPEGGSVDLLKNAPGPAAEIRALGGGKVAFRHTAVEVVSIGEGLGPETVLEAGGARWYRFDVPEEREIGVGVRAAADRVQARVVGAQGQTLAQGVVQKITLPAGTHYLVLEQAADARPVRVRPALAGIDMPDQGPPEATVRSYLKQAGLLEGGAQ